MNTFQRQKRRADRESFDLTVHTDETKRTSSAKPKAPRRQFSNWRYMDLAGQVGFDIALPMVLGLIVGTKLDARWGTHPIMTLGLFVVGLVISATSLIRIVQDIINER